MEEKYKKIYPASSSNMSKLLGIEPGEDHPAVSAVQASPPEGLPILEVHTLEADSQVHQPDAGFHTVDLTTTEVVKNANPGAQSNLYKTLLIVTSLLPYLAVFVVGLLVYYFLVIDSSKLPSFTKEKITAEEQARLDKKAALDELKQVEGANYFAWISQFYFDVSDPKVIDPDTLGKNGLTNFENYLLQLNPKNYDTLQNGKIDAANILGGLNPKTGKPLLDAERDIIAKYFDLEAIGQRVNYSPAPVNQNTSGSVIVPANTSSENKLEMNIEIPGRLEVPSIGVNVPIIWTKDPAHFDEDLKAGVVHYPGTPFPGSPGTSYISGHSSNYAWIKADYNKVFARIDELPIGVTFKVTVVGKDGKNIFLHYIVERKTTFKPEDQAQFENTADSVVALSTCWPINTVDNRRVAFGKLNRVEYE